MRFTVRAPHFKTIDLYQLYFSLLLLCKKETPDIGPGGSCCLSQIEACVSVTRFKALLSLS